MYRLNKDKPINAELIQALVNHFRLNYVSKLARLERYYKGNHDINQRVFDDPSKPNNKIVNPYPKYITDIATGYFMGSAIKYEVAPDNEDYQIRLQAIIDSNADSTHNMELAKQVSIYGVGYEFLYVNEVVEIKYTILDSKSTFVAYDNSVEEKPLFAVRILAELDYVTGENINSYEVYTKDEVIHYSEDDGDLVETERVVHYFGDVPIIEYRNNAERLGDFEPVLSLVDAYDGAVSDTANEINYFSDAYLKLSGMEDTDPEDIKKMKQMRVLLMPEGGDASFIVKQSDYESIEAFKNRLREDIHKFSMTPDLTDTNFAQNASGVAMRFKVLGLDNVTVNKENMFKGALAQRMKLITTILNIKGGNYDFNDVYFTFVRNLPQDNEALIKNAKEMLGLVSHETALSTLPSNIVDDTAYEMKQIQDEKTNSIYGTLEDI